MTVRLLDTLTGRLQDLEPLGPGHVRIYTCGPTVYGPAHVGNFRSFLFADLLVRHLRWRGHRVTWVMNLTDVDDKIIRRATDAGVGIEELAAHWIERFLDDARTLRMTQPDFMPRATRHVADMVALVERLLAAGHAYRTADGSIFFRIASWPAYGRLARVDPAQLRVGERVAADEYSKDDVRDFALWKGPKDGEPSWDTAIGPGRPGWHLECSAMSMRYLGESFDIHTGGVDLIFPHHEDEIAQSEGALGHRVVGIWMHGEFLTMADAKMAKSTGNSIRVADLPDMGYEPLAFRYLALTAHYRSKLDFSADALHAAASGLARLRRAVAAASPEPVDLAAEPMASYRARFTDAVADDLGTPRALAVAQAVSSADDLTDAQRRSLLLDFDRVLGLSLDVPVADAPLPAGAEELLARRAGARAARDWALSDALRDELAALGVDVRDTAAGQETTVRG